MRIAKIKVDHTFEVVFSGIHSLILKFKSPLDCRNAMGLVDWYCDKDKDFFVTSINERVLEIVYTKSTIHYHNGNIWVD